MRKMAAVMLPLFILCLYGCRLNQFPVSSGMEKTVITVLHGQSTSDPGLEDMLTNKITTQFPQLELEWESVDWGDYFSQELQAKIASGEVPDMIIGKAQDVAAYQPTGYLAPFDSSFAGYIIPEVVPSVSIDGLLYGIPYNAMYQGVLYNKDYFHLYGLDPPQTLDDLQTIITCFTEADIVPFASHFQENWYSANILMQFAVNDVFNHNPNWGDDFRAGQLSFAVSQSYQACFEQIKLILDHSWDDALNVTQSECIKRFAHEDAAMFMTGTWSVQTLRAIRPDMQIGLFPFPNQTGDAKLIFEPNITFMKNPFSEKSDIVNEIIFELLTDTQLAISIAEFTQTKPLLHDIESDSLSMVEDDIDWYTDTSHIVDVTLGNKQLVWLFQEKCAREIYQWLYGKQDLADVLVFADENRRLSS